MYSKNKGMTDRNYTLTPPPGYDGSRFRLRSDGRDDSFPLYEEEPLSKFQNVPERCYRSKRPSHETECNQKYCKNNDTDSEEEGCEDLFPLAMDTVHDCALENDDTECKKENGILPFLQNLGGEEILLIALIILIGGSQSRAGMETVLILTLLLCIS